ncbi:hypothetical protein COT50_02445 [candidate division WWE3 bacterium CG08_land_8_20_14_0_20_41_10]|uniref:Uncharacterized protein n=1 Tax=candidate division WWE3 bacterium CG08_land_8_20_14_0_20_41_10 TaxID=1975085 RepID=A0A2H0XDV2_UNCKA|nr:MAG: hypothetical protein COT50_02445 [candidate division WWE3 bacterium CG08_land_8_20_14_0_20_41_10]
MSLSFHPHAFAFAFHAFKVVAGIIVLVSRKMAKYFLNKIAEILGNFVLKSNLNIVTKAWDHFGDFTDMILGCSDREKGVFL